MITCHWYNKSTFRSLCTLRTFFFVLGGGDDTKVEVYDVEQGIFMHYLQFIILDIHRSVEVCYQHANCEIVARCSCTGQQDLCYWRL